MAKPASEMLIAGAVVGEIKSLEPTDIDQVITFLQHLAENPYDPTLIGTARAKGDLFASNVNDRLFVI